MRENFSAAFLPKWWFTRQTAEKKRKEKWNEWIIKMKMWKQKCFNTFLIVSACFFPPSSPRPKGDHNKIKSSDKKNVYEKKKQEVTIKQSIKMNINLSTHWKEIALMVRNQNRILNFSRTNVSDRFRALFDLENV